MLINLDFESSEPIYTQLVQEIIAGIAKKEILPGERLPSVRSLAADIGINLHTVNKAYQQLKQDGFILIHRQRGVVVNPDGIPAADEVYMNQLKKTLHPLVAESICRAVDADTFMQVCKELYQSFERGGKDE
ncbi:GntR family transcriptional regulator [Ornithinibacillus gellani]|uniref:GntR family transcriptional regulator n=1 Tax=Ornithinibacillus gellani TaxID=2293253 RepID=UPI000F4A0A11|nr:GntR family transcriptional regulator [Ornithinibacillus gellani]TQS70634.1 GntR family transcriptional regulator [Ornithinibacillus gellani]